MKVIITGCSDGIGYATTDLFLRAGHEVYGFDIKKAPNFEKSYEDFHYFCRDVSKKETLPQLPHIQILINNAGIQSNTREDMDVNFWGAVNCTEKYALNNPDIKSVLMVASVSAHTGTEFPIYCSSKGAMLTYTKWVAKEIAKYRATCNSISPGGVLTALNDVVITDMELWGKIMEDTPLKKWASPAEIAEWIYFITVINNSMTGQDVLIDNGECINQKFYWKD